MEASLVISTVVRSHGSPRIKIRHAATILLSTMLREFRCRYPKSCYLPHNPKLTTTRNNSTYFTNHKKSIIYHYAHASNFRHETCARLQDSLGSVKGRIVVNSVKATDLCASSGLQVGHENISISNTSVDDKATVDQPQSGLYSQERRCTAPRCGAPGFFD